MVLVYRSLVEDWIYAWYEIAEKIHDICAHQEPIVDDAIILSDWKRQ